MGFVRLLAVSRVVQLVLLITLFSNLAFDAMAEVALPVFSRDYLCAGPRASASCSPPSAPGRWWEGC